MNRFFIGEVASNINYIYDIQDIKHISKVLRLDKGDTIEVVDSNKEEYIMQIQDIQKNTISIKKIEKLSIKREPDIQIILYQAIPKNPKMEYICQKMTEIGVYEIVPIKFKRCVANDINDNKILRLQKIIDEASKQSKRLFVPKIRNAMSFKDMINDLQKNDKNIVFYEEERNKSIKDFIKNSTNIKRLGIIIGSEGGIDEEEISILKDNDVDVLTLGNRILRTETAGLVASSILIYEFENGLKL